MDSDRITSDAVIRHAPTTIIYSDTFFSLAAHKKPHPRIGFLASHSGSSMQKIITAIEQHILPGCAHIVISNNADSPALTYARAHGIPTAHLSRLTHGDPDTLDHAIAEHLIGCDWVILSGYMRPLGPEVIAQFPQRILNIHPALLPEFGGQGMYGRAVHQAVIDSRASYSGATIHLVDDTYDTGPILAQLRIPVDPHDTVDELEDRIKKAEPDFFITVLRKLL